MLPIYFDIISALALYIPFVYTICLYSHVLSIAPVHMQRGYYFGVKNTIQRLFADKEFVAERSTEREAKGSFYGSSYAKAIYAFFKKRMDDKTVSLYGVGFDFGQIYNHKKYSMGIIAMRCEDLPGKLISKRRFTLPLAIIPGPKEPEHLDVYFQPIIAEFKELQNGMKVEVDRDGVLQEEHHTPILSTLYADMPARCKLAKAMGSAAAVLGCQFCWLNGTSVGGTTRFLAYLNAVTTVLGDPSVQGREFKMGEDDEARRLTHQQQKERSEKAEAAIQAGENFDPGTLGTHGNSKIFQQMPHLDRNLCWAPCFFHMVFLGPVKHLFAIMIKGDEKNNPEIKDFKLKGLKKLEELESHFIITSDMGRPYEPMDSVRMYIIEHCVRFLEVYSSLLFNKDVVGFDPLTPKARKAFGHLRRGIGHFLRLHEEIETDEDLKRWEERREEAKQELISFGKMMEQVRDEILSYILNYYIR